MYLSNYWSLYSEFIYTFQHLRYRNIPICLMTNFYQQIDDKLNRLMEQDNFSSHLSNAKIKDMHQIQPFFEHHLQPLKKPLEKKQAGKILINLDYIRIPGNKLVQYFSLDKTIILSRSRLSHYLGFPNAYLGKFTSDTKNTSQELINRAQAIFSQYTHHPAFSNSFFMNTFIQRIPIIVDTLEAVFKLYEQTPCSGVLVGTTEDVVSRALAIIGSMKGIPSICLQHGILMGEEAFIPVFSSHIAVYGDYEKRWYIKRGMEEKRIAGIGHPRYDAIFEHPSGNKTDYLKKYNLNPTKKTIVIATGPHIDELKFNDMMNRLLKNDQYQFLIKPHPWELAKNKIALYLKLTQKNPSVQVINDKKANILDLICHADAVITSLSTTALESCLLNKPVFVYYFLQSNRYYDYFDRLEQHMQSDPAKLVQMISLYFNNQKIRNAYTNIKKSFLQDSYKPRNASKELIEFLYQLTNVKMN
ncbi:CDP-glycerol glycerophosphotransferase family protein [Niallia nealsonii]|nr:CDP-glycerol glycerophosphotransferase family protein [Niallia nealsonii]